MLSLQEDEINRQFYKLVADAYADQFPEEEEDKPINLCKVDTSQQLGARVKLESQVCVRYLGMMMMMMRIMRIVMGVRCVSDIWG